MPDCFTRRAHPPRSPDLSLPRRLAFAALLASLHLAASAQQLASANLPDSPGFQSQASDAQPAATLTGTVKDLAGSVVFGATLTITGKPGTAPQIQTSDTDGRFTFTDLPHDRFQLTITEPGFALWTDSVDLRSTQTLDLPAITMHLASTSADVEVDAHVSEIAAAQVKLEERQRVLGVFPNFYAVYIWNAAPLTPKQKFSLSWKSSIDPVTFVVAGITAGVEQGSDDFAGYGQGAQGFAKRYGAVYADGFISSMIGGAILPSVLHQDPRYFVMGNRGTIRKRILYALASPVICKSDKGRWQPNYSNVLGNVASAAISNAYYPATDRNGAGLTIENSIIGTASGAISSLIQEFVLRKITPDVPNYGDTTPETLPSPSTSPKPIN